MALRAFVYVSFFATPIKALANPYLDSLQPSGATRLSPPWSNPEPLEFVSEYALIAHYQPYCEGQVEVMSLDPPVVMLHDFISPEDCKVLTACSERVGFSASTVSAEQEGLSEVRSSTTCWLNPLKLGDLGGENAASAILSRIDALVAAFCQVSEDNLESLQVVRYENGQQFNYHTDTISEYNQLECGGRLASCLFYLNEGYVGGHTHFPELNLSVAPRTGAALVWYNCELPYTKGDMVPDTRLTHAGMPAGGGESTDLKKYAANKWVHAKAVR